MKKYILGSYIHGNITLRILKNFIFGFLATLLFAKICSVTLTLLFAYFLSLKISVRPFYFIFGLCFLCESCSAPHELSNGMQHDHIWKKKFSTLWDPGFKIHHFRFSAIAEAVCTPTMATCVFFHFLVSNDRN